MDIAYQTLATQVEHIEDGDACRLSGPGAHGEFRLHGWAKGGQRLHFTSLDGKLDLLIDADATEFYVES